MPNTTDLDALIAEAERAVIAADARFVHATGELAGSVRGHAGRAVKQAATVCAVGGVTVLGAWWVYAMTARRRRAARVADQLRAAPVRRLFSPTSSLPPPLPPRSKAAGFLGDTIGSALRSGTTPRSAGLVSMLAMPVLSMLLRRGRAQRR